MAVRTLLEESGSGYYVAVLRPTRASLVDTSDVGA